MAYRPFSRDRDGHLHVRLHAGEVDLLLGLAGQLAALLEEPPDDDAAVQRLFPRAYLDPTEERADEELRAFAHADLLRSRLDALASLVAALGGAFQRRASGTEADSAEVVEMLLSEEQEAEWLGVLNDARLALGTYLQVTEETTEEDFDPATPAFQSYLVYTWLTALQGELVEVLLGDLPED